MRDKLIELAERCEGASGADRELDARIWCALRDAEFPEPPYEAMVPDYDQDAAGTIQIETITRNGLLLQCRKDQSPAYTASLDAAMTLVPEGHAYRLDGWTAFTARVFIPEKRYLSAHSNRSMALALTAAALRARAAIERADHTPKEQRHEQ